MGEIVGAFIHEAENDPSGAPIYITIFTIAAFVFFLLGAYCAGGMTFEDVYGLFSWKITYP